MKHSLKILKLPLRILLVVVFIFVGGYAAKVVVGQRLVYALRTGPQDGCLYKENADDINSEWVPCPGNPQKTEVVEISESEAKAEGLLYVVANTNKREDIRTLNKFAQATRLVEMEKLGIPTPQPFTQKLAVVYGKFDSNGEPISVTNSGEVIAIPFEDVQKYGFTSYLVVTDNTAIDLTLDAMSALYAQRNGSK